MNKQEENKGLLYLSTVTPTIMLEIKEDELITGKESPEYELSVEENKEEYVLLKVPKKDLADIMAFPTNFKLIDIEAIKQAEREKVTREIIGDVDNDCECFNRRVVKNLKAKYLKE